MNHDLSRIVTEAGSIMAAERLLRSRGVSISARTIKRRLMGEGRASSPSLDYEVDMIPPRYEVSELLAERRAKFQRKVEHHTANDIRVVRMRSNQPIGIGMMGDPHIDDDGTDIDLLFRHADIFDGRNPGVHAVLLGDCWNNWIGTLSRLWAEQSTSAAEARVLVEHFLRKIEWLAVVFGNHDDWSGWSEILSHILVDKTKIAGSYGQKVRIEFPNGRSVMINARHKYSGRSQWVKQFGQIKSASLDGQSDIYVGGDLHVSGYSNGWHDGTKKMYHALQVASYKSIDRYAQQLGLTAHDPYVCPIAVINPAANTPASFVHMEFDPFEGADRVKWLRQRT